MAKEKQYKSALYCIATLMFMGFVSLIIVFSWHWPAYHDCYIENKILLNQSFNEHYGFLEMTVLAPIGERSLSSISLYYFAGEFELREDLQPGDNLKIRWCSKDKNADYFIRGVWKE